MVTINRATRPENTTTIGNNCFFMAVVHAGHDVVVHDNVIIANNTPLGGFVEVFSGAFISANCAVHQFVKVGRYTMTGGLTKVVSDVPPFVTTNANPAAFKGLNAIGLKRAGFKPEQRKEIKHLYKIIYQQNSRISLILEKLANEKNTPVQNEIFNFIKNSKRGIIQKRNK